MITFKTEHCDREEDLADMINTAITENWDLHSVVSIPRPMYGDTQFLLVFHALAIFQEDMPAEATATG